jgi:hypothetical protein
VKCKNSNNNKLLTINDLVNYIISHENRVSAYKK